MTRAGRRPRRHRSSRRRGPPPLRTGRAARVGGGPPDGLGEAFQAQAGERQRGHLGAERQAEDPRPGSGGPAPQQHADDLLGCAGATGLDARADRPTPAAAGRVGEVRAGGGRGAAGQGAFQAARTGHQHGGVVPQERDAAAGGGAPTVLLAPRVGRRLDPVEEGVGEEPERTAVGEAHRVGAVTAGPVVHPGVVVAVTGEFRGMPGIGGPGDDPAPAAVRGATGRRRPRQHPRRHDGGEEQGGDGRGADHRGRGHRTPPGLPLPLGSLGRAHGTEPPGRPAAGASRGEKDDSAPYGRTVPPAPSGA